MAFFCYADFTGDFGDFETLFHDAELSKYNIRFWMDGYCWKKRITGITRLDNDYLLHLVNVGEEEEDEETETLLKKHGIEFVALSIIIGNKNNGMSILPQDQPEE